MLFRHWLAQEMERKGLSRREVARRLAAQPGAGTFETYRRAMPQYLSPDQPQQPTAAMRARFAVALDVDVSEVPDDDDDESSAEPMSRDELQLFAVLARRAAALLANSEAVA